MSGQQPIIAFALKPFVPDASYQWVLKDTPMVRGLSTTT